MSNRRWVSACFLFLMAAAIPLFAAEGPVTIVQAGAGYSIWLPGKLSADQQHLALYEAHRFQKTWALFFGQPPALPDPLVVPAGKDLDEALFTALWDGASRALDPPDRPAAQAALRGEVLDDPSPFVDALARPALSARLGAEAATGPLLYRYLKDAVDDKEFLPDALPPGEGTSRLKAALAERGVPWQSFMGRYAAWILGRGIESHLMAPPAGTLPAIWVLDGDLAPGEFSFWRFTLTEEDEGVDLQIAGPSTKGVLLFHFYTDEAGRVTRSGLADLKGERMLLPRAGKTLWLALWNTSAEGAGTGMTLTLWKDLEPPFVVKRASMNETACDLLLEEGPGIADYGLWSHPSPGAEFLPLPVGRFLSEGEGEHHYHLRLTAPAPDASALRVGCRTTAGGFYSAEVRLSEPSPP